MRIDIILDVQGESLSIAADDESGSGVARLIIDPSELPANLEGLTGTITVAVANENMAQLVLDSLLFTDQEVVIQEPCSYTHGDVVTVTSNVQINETLVSDTATFTVPLPEKIYDSWVWNSDELKWEAPIEMPDASLSHLYDWDEEAGNWVLGSE